MSHSLSVQDLNRIENGIRDKYAKVAVNPEGQFEYPTGRAGLEKLKYDAAIVAELPDAVTSNFCGVGNPFSLGKIATGARVLDIGCGAGVDALVASKVVGPSGSVVGIDITPEMIQRAEANKKRIGAQNIAFQLCRVQDLIGIDGSFDVIISNGAINLVPEKQEVLKAAFRLLKPGGWFLAADVFLVGTLSKDMNARIRSWFQ